MLFVGKPAELWCLTKGRKETTGKLRPGDGENVDTTYSQREKSGGRKGSWVPSESKTKQGKIHQILRLKSYPLWCHTLSSRPPGVILLWGPQGQKPDLSGTQEETGLALGFLN